MKKLLITHHKDSSLELFKKVFKNELLVLDYQSDLANFDSFLDENDDVEVIYVRDPFPLGLSWMEIESKLKPIFGKGQRKGLRFIDSLTTINQIREYEDKWFQFQNFSEFMSPTRKLEKLSDVDWNDELVKKRISSRALGIYFDSAELRSKKIVDSDDGYIVQRKIDIKREYRIYAINKELYRSVSIRRSKSIDQHVRIVGVEEADEQLWQFIEKVHCKQQKLLNFDLIGYDVVQTGDDEFFLLEINRSPQFAAFKREGGINIAEQFIF